VKLQLRFPATPENAADHAQLAVRVSREEYDEALDFSPESLERVDQQIEGLRDEGRDGEEVAELLFVLGCYLGQVMVLSLDGQWVATAQSALRGISPWPMVVVLPGGSTWDPIGKAYKRLELGDSEYLPAYYATAAAGRRYGPDPS
jgi:hypothetical protein